jgi:hypothetical protein
MSWKGFLRWLRPDFSAVRQPTYLKDLTPEERAERRRRSANLNWFGIQMFDPPPAHPHKAPWSSDDGERED